MGPAKDGTDGRRRVDAKDDHAVPQRRNVGHDDVDNVHEPQVADPEERVGGGVRLDVAARGLHDHAEDDEEEHGEETLDAAPDIDDLGNGRAGHAVHDGGDDGSRREEAVLVEGGDDIGYQVALHGLEEGFDELDEPEARGPVTRSTPKLPWVCHLQAEYPDQALLGPHLGDGLDLLHAVLLELHILAALGLLLVVLGEFSGALLGRQLVDVRHHVEGRLGDGLVPGADDCCHMREVYGTGSRGEGRKRKRWT